MRLHGYFRSSTSYRVRIALHLKGLDYEHVAVNLRTGEQRSEAFASINAHQTVPVLEVGDQKLAQSLAILHWLEAEHPEPSLLPADATGAQICRELYYAVATEVHAPNNLNVLNYLKEHFGADQAMLEAWNQRWVTRTFAAVETRLGQLEWLSADLPFGRPSLFEVVLVPQIYNARRWKTDMTAFPMLKRIDAACASREAFATAHPSRQPDCPQELR